MNSDCRRQITLTRGLGKEEPADDEEASEDPLGQKNPLVVQDVVRLRSDAPQGGWLTVCRI